LHAEDEFTLVCLNPDYWGSPDRHASLYRAQDLLEQMQGLSEERESCVLQSPQKTESGEAVRHTADTSTRAAHRWIALGLVTGAIFRLLQYLGNRSLWLDEALLAPWILDASLGDIVDPSRISPVAFGFMGAIKALTLLLGESELVLRLVPLVAGLAALLVFHRAAARLLSPTGATVAVGLFALSPFLIYYASELKAYSVDVATTALFLAVAAGMMTSPVAIKGAVLWGATAVLAVSVSVTAALVIAGTGAAVMVVRSRAGDIWSVMLVATASLPSAVLVLLPYLRRRGLDQGAEAAAGEPGFMDAFWTSGFMPVPPRSMDEWLWLPTTLFRVFHDPLGLMHNTSEVVGTLLAVLMMITAAVGIAALARHRPGALLLALAPILVALAASGMRLYPFGADWNTGGRVILFLVPCFYLLIGAGAGWLIDSAGRPIRIIGISLVAVLLAPALLQAATTIPYGRGEMKPLLEFFREHRQPGDRLYVHYDALPAFRYYAPRYGIEETVFVEGICARFEEERYLEALAELRGEPRVWVLFTAGLGANLLNERELMVSFLEHSGHRLDDRVARGTFLYLYDLQTPPLNSSPFGVHLAAREKRVEEGCALWQG
jgi:hypothetical protein